jgi:hypothetical protein
MTSRPKSVYILILLWLSLSIIFILWAVYSLIIVINIQNWTDLPEGIISQIHFGYLIGTIVWFVFSSLFTIFAYATYRRDSWGWTTGLIISTIFLVIFTIMIVAFMVNAIIFVNWFSVLGLITTSLSFAANLGIVFYLTRPVIKLYFEVA